MSVSERLVPFGYSLQSPLQLSDGYVANYVVYWSSAAPRGPEAQDDMPIRLRNHRLYTSALTHANAVPRASSLQGKLDNWAFLNAKVFPRLGIELKAETIQNLVKGDRNTLVAFFDMLFNAIDAAKREGFKRAEESQAAGTNSREERLASILAKSDLVMNPKTTKLEPRRPLLAKTAREQREYAERLSSLHRDIGRETRFESHECEKCRLYEKKIRCLEEENAFLRQKLAERE